MSNVMGRDFSPQHRGQQVRETLGLWSEMPVAREIQRWMRDQNEERLAVLSTGAAPLPLTGTLVVRMDEQEAKRLAEEMPEVSVLRDAPLDLIRPAVVGQSHRDQVSAAETWHLDAAGLRAARKRGFTGTGQGVIVAVLDTGIAAEHQEIAGSVAEAYTFDVANWRPVRSATPFDTHGHGTHVAGLIAGRNTGVAPGAQLVDGMMLPNGRGNLSDFLLAMEAVVQSIETPAQIVNMSAGLQGFLPEMAGAVAGIVAAGALPVFAVGNEGRNRTRSPGNFVDPISVGACRQDRKVASFSGSGTIVHENHQYTVPDLVAPGEQVYSCVRGGGYEAWSGTSMAAPIVSGVAALILERYPLIQPADLIEELLAKCENLGEDAIRQGRGMVNCEPLL